jgi:asparagine synthase (glutamine-hydrolysing)
VTPAENRAFLARGMDDFHTHLRTLLRSNDKMAISVSVEARVPFLSNTLIDFAFHLNAESKFNQNRTKYIVKKAAEKRLPHKIVHAKKVGFGFTSPMWKNGVEILRDGMVPDLFKWGEKEAEKIYEDLESDRSILFSLISIELWAQIFLNNQSPEDLTEILLAKLKCD